MYLACSVGAKKSSILAGQVGCQRPLGVANAGSGAGVRATRAAALGRSGGD
jgi:hypothetical protein